MPRPSVRLRLTLLYSALFLVSGAVLLAITYVLFQRATGINLIVPTMEPNLSPHARSVVESKFADLESNHADDLHQLLIQSGIALAIMTLVSLALGWLVAGRVLRPLRQMTSTTRQISERNLHERLALPGPRDELKDLADTIDALLARLETAFDAQQRFVANAAHELRTPLTLWRALLEERLTDPNATIDSFRVTSRRLLELGDEQERLLEALLTLAWSERGLDRCEPFDLAEVVESALRDLSPEAESLGVRIHSVIGPALTAGDAALAERLVRNLIDNAAQYNVPGGQMQVRVGTRSGTALLAVANDGPVIPPAEVERLFYPFHRLGTDRTEPNGGHQGLGLSIVRAVATAHNASLLAKPRLGGGLAVEIGFPSTG
jgi:signal transduction histidine kinase